MGAIFRRELRSFFTSPIGYCVLALTFGFSGYFFYLYNMGLGMPSLTYVFGNLYTILLLLVLPVMAMRLLSDERRNRTDQALLTAPVSLTGIVLGKFLSAMLVYAISISVVFIYGLVIAFQLSPDWMTLVGNYLGLLLLGSLILSIGMLISAFTESQFIAAIGTFAVSFGLLMIDQLKSLFANSSMIATVVDFLSVSQRYNSFTVGLIEYDNLFFFVSMSALFLFFTVRVLDHRRWA